MVPDRGNEGYTLLYRCHAGPRDGETEVHAMVTNGDIAQWIDNDEGLYNWWKSSRLSKREFIKQNRDELRRCIEGVLSGAKPAHYLAYPLRTGAG